MGNLEDTLKNLKIAYLKKLESDIPMLRELESGKIDMEVAMKILSVVHKISGTGGMYGLKVLSEACCDFESKLNEIKNDENLLNENIVKSELSAIISLIITTIKEDNCQAS